MNIKIKSKFTSYHEKCNELIQQGKLFCSLNIEQLTDIDLLNSNVGATVIGYSIEKETYEEYINWIIDTFDNTFGALIKSCYELNTPLEAELIIVNDVPSHLWLKIRREQNDL